MRGSLQMCVLGQIAFALGWGSVWCRAKFPLDDAVQFYLLTLATAIRRKIVMINPLSYL